MLFYDWEDGVASDALAILGDGEFVGFRGAGGEGEEVAGGGVVAYVGGDEVARGEVGVGDSNGIT